MLTDSVRIYGWGKVETQKVLDIVYSSRILKFFKDYCVVLTICGGKSENTIFFKNCFYFIKNVWCYRVITI